jgi:sirohydrochlorin ferrochelatase
MTSMMLRIVLCVFLASTSSALAQSKASEGILLLAHGGQSDWNQRVVALAADVNATQPVEVAFGMASRAAIQGAVDRLIARGVRSIVAVPLFVSSHSSVVTSTAYLLGLRDDMPADLKIFAKMSHAGHGAGTTTADHAGHVGSNGSAPDPTTPIVSSVPIRMTPALNRHPLVASILRDRARDISVRPAEEAVIIVAHGPVPDDDNERWLADMKALATHIGEETSFAALDYLTVRDDAPKPVRDAATAQLRTLVTSHTAAGRRVLIVPLLLSYGGIEKGIRQRLEGLDYTMAANALMPDSRLADWVRLSVAQ